MNNKLFLVYLLLHVLADFHLQTETLAQNKANTWKAMLFHGLIYGAVMMLPVIAGADSLMTSLVLAASHLMIDLIKRQASKETKSQQESLLLFADQALHLVMIVLCCKVFFNSPGGRLIQSLNDDHIKWTLLLLLVTKPANIVMKTALKRYLPSSDNQGVKGAGAMIGNLERILTAVFLGLGQFAAIGLVFTAKSIARFDRISKDQGFAEYYLIGSLTSILWVFTWWLLLFKL